MVDLLRIEALQLFHVFHSVFPAKLLEESFVFGREELFDDELYGVTIHVLLFIFL